MSTSSPTRAAAIALVALVLLVAIFAQAASGGPSASRVVDRTLVCAMGIWGGVRRIELRAESGTRDIADPNAWKVRPSIEVSNPYAGLHDGLAGFSAGYPPAGGLWMVPNPARCKPAKRIPFSRNELVAVAAGPFGDEYECLVSKKVLVRVRAVYTAPTELKRIFVDPLRRTRLLTASGEITQGELAVRTESGKPLAYGSADVSGKARLQLAKACGPS